MKLNSVLSNLWLFIVLGVLIIFWPIYAPLQLGGRMSFQIVRGVSMLPTLTQGDFIISQKADSYAIGDIVCFKEPMTQAIIIHRVIAKENGYYITQGDNRKEPDYYKSTDADIVGKALFHIPQLGEWINSMRSPWLFAVLAGILGLIVLSDVIVGPKPTQNQSKGVGFMTSAPVRKNSNAAVASAAAAQAAVTAQAAVENHAGNPPPIFTTPIQENGKAKMNASVPTDPTVPNQKPMPIEVITPVLAVIALILGGFLVWSFLQPMTIPGEPLQYVQNGQFAYTASAIPGIYDLGNAQTGDPIFTKLTCNLSVSFAYSMVGNGLENLAGTYQLYYQVVDRDNGWKKTVPIVTTTSFTGPSVSSTNDINVCQVLEIIEKYEADTGTRQGFYIFDLIGKVAVNGTLQGATVAETLDANVPFMFDRSNFSVMRDDPKIDPFTFSKEGKVDNPAVVRNVISLLGIRLYVNQARLVLIVLLILVVFGLAYFGMALNQKVSEDIDARIKLMYGALIVDASDLILKLAPIIEFETIDELAKLAVSQHTAVLRTEYLGQIFYTVRVGDISYRYIHSPAGNN